MTASCEWVDVGSGLKAYYGKPAGAGPHPCLVVYIEAFGVNEHFKKLTQRLADEGFATITPDIYGGDTYSYEDLGNAIGKLKTMNDDVVMKQTEQCLDWLSHQSEADDQNLELITTEKDYVKINDLNNIINVLPIEMEINMKEKAVFKTFLKEKLNG